MFERICVFDITRTLLPIVRAVLQFSIFCFLAAIVGNNVRMASDTHIRLNVIVIPSYPVAMGVIYRGLTGNQGHSHRWQSLSGAHCGGCLTSFLFI